MGTWLARLLWLPVLMLIAGSAGVLADVQLLRFDAAGAYLIVEVLDDDLVHIELSSQFPGPDVTGPLYTSPMVSRTDYPGPSFFQRNGSDIDTREMKLSVDPSNLCMTFSYKPASHALTTVCPQDLSADWKGVSFSREHTTNVYGLGQQFKELGSADGDWLQHRVREEQPAGQEQGHGNGFMPFGPAGLVGNVQFPVMYARGDWQGAPLDYAIFMDNVYKQRWDFSTDPWQVRMWGDQIRFYFLTGPDLPDLRRDYMELVGRPPVPPRKAFGLWVSEFGYHDWDQIKTLRDGLRRDRFPLDGFVLDLQWFGGVIPSSPDSAMGQLDWDLAHFPDPATHIAEFSRDGVGLAAIEESYVSEHTDTFSQMNASGNLFAYSRKNGTCDPAQQAPVMLTSWFGKAAMIDWSNPLAGDWVASHRRLPKLTGKGVTTHWTDLGEPEKYDSTACYHGVETTATGLKNTHGDIHNLYAFLWNKSIWDGYFAARNQIDRRPFILSRSGASGSQRWGVAMWSGDIGSNLDLLATHLNSQMHMAFSGIDYYGADIGGFRREGLPYNAGHSGRLQYQNELFTQWFANGAWFDVPVRPHTDNSFQTTLSYETSPNLVGDLRSNRENLRQRYELIPYYYSLAYRAHFFGDPVFPPLVHYYENDVVVRNIGHEKLIGRDLLVGVVARHGEYARDVYLPKGRWINYHTRDWFETAGGWIRGVPTYLDGVFRLPAFARAGAILPMMATDEQTKDAFGHRQQGGLRDELIAQIYADGVESQSVLYEDDGLTLSYDAAARPIYRVRTTTLSQQLTGNIATVRIEPAMGDYAGAPMQRNNLVRLIVDNAKASEVTLSGQALAQRTSETAFEANSSGWLNAGRNLILVKSGVRNVAARKIFKVVLQNVAPTSSVNLVCDNAWTMPGEAIYAVGNTSALGNWDLGKAVKLSPSVYYEYIFNPPPGHNGPGPDKPKWTGVAEGIPASANLEWKCVRRLVSGQWQVQSGPNNFATMPASGFAGTSVGSF